MQSLLVVLLQDVVLPVKTRAVAPEQVKQENVQGGAVVMNLLENAYALKVTLVMHVTSIQHQCSRRERKKTQRKNQSMIHSFQRI